MARNAVAVNIRGRILNVSITKDAPIAGNVDTNTLLGKIQAFVGPVHLTEFEIFSSAERLFQFREALDADSASLALSGGILTLSE